MMHACRRATLLLAATILATACYEEPTAPAPVVNASTLFQQPGTRPFAAAIVAPAGLTDVAPPHEPGDRVNAALPRLDASTVYAGTFVYVLTWYPIIDGESGALAGYLKVLGQTLSWQDFAALHLALYQKAVATNDRILTVPSMYSSFANTVAGGGVDVNVAGMAAFLELNSLRSKHRQWTEFRGVF